MSSLLKVTFEIDLSVFEKNEWKFTRTFYYRTLLSKKAVKQPFFLFEIFYIFYGETFSQGKNFAR